MVLCEQSVQSNYSADPNFILCAVGMEPQLFNRGALLIIKFDNDILEYDDVMS